MHYKVVLGLVEDVHTRRKGNRGKTWIQDITQLNDPLILQKAPQKGLQHSHTILWHYGSEHQQHIKNIAYILNYQYLLWTIYTTKHKYLLKWSWKDIDLALSVCPDEYLENGYMECIWYRYDSPNWFASNQNWSQSGLSLSNSQVIDPLLGCFLPNIVLSPW